MGAAKLLTAAGGGITLDAASTATDKTITIPAVTGVAMTAVSNASNAQFNTITGTAPLYSARAWVNFNGTGTVAIRASGNVSSITDNGVGLYTLNYSTVMPDANYNIVGTSATASGAIGLVTSVAGATDFSKSTTTTAIMTINVNASIPGDYNSVNVAIFR